MHLLLFLLHIITSNTSEQNEKIFHPSASVFLHIIRVSSTDGFRPLVCVCARARAALEQPVEEEEVERVQEEEDDADGVSSALGFAESLPPAAGVVEMLYE